MRFDTLNHSWCSETIWEQSRRRRSRQPTTVTDIWYRYNFWPLWAFLRDFWCRQECWLLFSWFQRNLPTLFGRREWWLLRGGLVGDTVQFELTIHRLKHEKAQTCMFISYATEWITENDHTCCTITHFFVLRSADLNHRFGGRMLNLNLEKIERRKWVKAQNIFFPAFVLRAESHCRRWWARCHPLDREPSTRWTLQRNCRRRETSYSLWASLVDQDMFEWYQQSSTEEQELQTADTKREDDLSSKNIAELSLFSLITFCIGV